MLTITKKSAEEPDFDFVLPVDYDWKMNPTLSHLKRSAAYFLAMMFTAFYPSLAQDTNAIEPLQITKPVSAVLPDSWDGVWSGEIKVIVDGETRHAVNMELTVAPIKGRSAKTWVIQYAGQPPRPYEIISAPDGKGHFQVDEKNGTVLDAQLIGDTLHSAFSVGTVLLTSRFERRGRELHVEITSYDHSGKTSTTSTNSEAINYPPQSVQVGILRRQKNDAPGRVRLGKF